MADIRYTYAYGYKSKDAAIDALDGMIADSEISLCEKPDVSSYSTPRGKRYKITLLDTACA